MFSVRLEQNLKFHPYNSITIPITNQTPLHPRVLLPLGLPGPLCWPEHALQCTSQHDWQQPAVPAGSKVCHCCCQPGFTLFSTQQQRLAQQQHQLGGLTGRGGEGTRVEGLQQQGSNNKVHGTGFRKQGSAHRFQQVTRFGSARYGLIVQTPTKVRGSV